MIGYAYFVTLVIYLSYMRNLLSFLFKGFRRKEDEDFQDGSLLAVQKIDSELTDNMRALRLVATMCDQMVSRGMPVSDVTFLGLGVTETYCSRKVHIDISHTILTISQDRGIDREPLTLVRTIALRGTDYNTLQMLEDLAVGIRTREVTIDDAERRLDHVIARKPIYPAWLIHVAGGGISAVLKI